MRGIGEVRAVFLEALGRMVGLASRALLVPAPRVNTK
jgi:hypothetical protein